MVASRQPDRNYKDNMKQKLERCYKIYMVCKESENNSWSYFFKEAIEISVHVHSRLILPALPVSVQ